MNEPNKPPLTSAEQAEAMFNRVLEKLDRDPLATAKLTAHVRARTKTATFPGYGALPAANGDMVKPGKDHVLALRIWSECLRALVLWEGNHSDPWGELLGSIPNGQATVEPIVVTYLGAPVAKDEPKPVVPVVPVKDITDPITWTKVLKTTGKAPGSLEQTIIDLVQPLIDERTKSDTDVDQVNAIAKAITESILKEKFNDLSVKMDGKVNEYLRSIPPRQVIRIEPPNKKPAFEIARQHYKFELLLAALRAQCHVLMVGPPGTGKSHTAHAASTVYEKEIERAEKTKFFDSIPVGPMTSKADLFGMIDAGGRYHDTAMVRCARDGGVFLADELDSGNAGVLTMLGMVNGNAFFSIPTGTLVKSPHYRFIGTANTYGMGGSRVFCGRNELDKATIDRVVVIDWPCDEGLESSLIGVKKESPKLILGEGGILKNDDWNDRVVRVRRAAEKLGVLQIFGTRAVVSGMALFNVGVGLKHVDEMCLWKGMEMATRQKLLTEARLN